MRSFLRESSLLIWSGVGTFLGLQGLNGNSRFYSDFLMPHVHFFFSPESAHCFAVKLMSYGFVPKSQVKDDPILESKLLGKKFSNPIGIAAGFDKHAEAMKGLKKVGFGFIEVGSVTPKPQKGNEKPRVFRLAEDYAVINRYGFNSCGHDAVAKRLKDYRKGKESDSIVLGVNLGKNKTSPSAVDDYVLGVEKLGAYSDYIVVNVSSPNTPGLRKLQEGDSLEKICLSVINARNKLANKPPVLVKIAPDLNAVDRKEIAEVVVKSKVDGLIVSNTTISRADSLRSNHKNEVGGLSGEPLRITSTQLIADMYRYTDGKIPIIGVGGVKNGLDAYEKIRAGASLIQLYTSLVYQGPPVVDDIKKQLTFLLKHDQFQNLTEAVGADHR